MQHCLFTAVEYEGERYPQNNLGSLESLNRLLRYKYSPPAHVARSTSPTLLQRLSCPAIHLWEERSKYMRKMYQTNTCITQCGTKRSNKIHKEVNKGMARQHGLPQLHIKLSKVSSVTLRMATGRNIFCFLLLDCSRIGNHHDFSYSSLQ